MERKLLLVRRDCPAMLVPEGTRMTIARDTFVTLTQSLGGSYTVNVSGNLARIEGQHADALGFEPLKLEFTPSAGQGIDEDHVWQALRSVYDPEVPVDLVELGLIYRVQVHEHQVQVTMTLTAPGCGMGPVLVEEVKSRVGMVPGVQRVQVELVFDPPWSRDMMSEAAQLALGVYGQF